MSGNVASLQDALAQVRDFRHPQGRRYKLQTVLVLSCLAMMNGAQSEQAIADWSGNQGRRWMSLLGVRRQRGPSSATIHRIFKGIDRTQLESAFSQWSQQVVDAQPVEIATAPASKNDSFAAMSQWADLLKAQLQAGSDDEHISEAGLKIWGMELDPVIANPPEPRSVYF